MSWRSWKGESTLAFAIHLGFVIAPQLLGKSLKLEAFDISTLLQQQELKRGRTRRKITGASCSILHRKTTGRGGPEYITG